MIQIEYEKPTPDTVRLSLYCSHSYKIFGSICRWISYGYWRGVPVHCEEDEYESEWSGDCGWFTTDIMTWWNGIEVEE